VISIPAADFPTEHLQHYKTFSSFSGWMATLAAMTCRDISHEPASRTANSGSKIYLLTRARKSWFFSSLSGEGTIALE